MNNPGTPTFDQLRIFLTIVDTGSFAAAGRKLNRAVSVISYGIANLEAQLGVLLPTALAMCIFLFYTNYTVTGRKGKILFQPLRRALTGLDHGPDMGQLLPLIGRDEALKRLAVAG